MTKTDERTQQPQYSRQHQRPRFDKPKSKVTVTKDATTSTASSDLSGAPCDKTYITCNKRHHLDFIAPYRSSKRMKFRRPFKFDPSYSSRYEFPGGRHLFVYSNEYVTEFQLNPTQWHSYFGWNELCKLLLGEEYHSAKITRLALHDDIPFPLDETLGALKFTRLSVTDVFEHSERVSTKAGHIKEVEFTSRYGSQRRKSFLVYDSGKKHNLPRPTTRIERQFNHPQSVPIKKLIDFPKLKDMAPFRSIKPLKIVPVAHLSRRDQERFDYFTLLTKEKGVHKALAFLRAKDRKHFEERYKNVIKSLKAFDLKLDEIFQKNMAKFLAIPISAGEASLIAELKLLKYGKSKTSPVIEMGDVSCL